MCLFVPFTGANALWLCCFCFCCSWSIGVEFYFEKWNLADFNTGQSGECSLISFLLWLLARPEEYSMRGKPCHEKFFSVLLLALILFPSGGKFNMKPPSISLPCHQYFVLCLCWVCPLVKALMAQLCMCMCCACYWVLTGLISCPHHRSLSALSVCCL